MFHSRPRTDKPESPFFKPEAWRKLAGGANHRSHRKKEASPGGASEEFALCGLDENVRAIFELARLDQIFRIFPDRKTAQAAL